LRSPTEETIAPAPRRVDSSSSPERTSPASPFFVLLGQEGQHGQVVIHGGVLHAQWTEEVLIEKFAIGSAGGTFEDDAQKVVARAAVGLLLTGFMRQGGLPEVTVVFPGRLEVLVVLGEVRRDADEALGDSEGVVQQMANSNPLPVSLREFGEVGGDRPVEIDNSQLDELHGQNCGEDLGDRSNLELCIRTVGDIELPVGQTVALVEKHSIARSHENDPTEEIILRVYDPVDIFSERLRFPWESRSLAA